MCYFKTNGTLGKKAKELVEEYTQLQNEINKLLERQKEIKQKLMEKMVESDIKKFEHENVSVTYIPETTQKRFDSKTFKIEHPDLYNKYIKEVAMKATIRFSEIKQKDK